MTDQTEIVVELDSQDVYDLISEATSHAEAQDAEIERQKTWRTSSHLKSKER